MTVETVGPTHNKELLAAVPIFESLTILLLANHVIKLGLSKTRGIIIHGRKFHPELYRNLASF